MIEKIVVCGREEAFLWVVADGQQASGRRHYDNKHVPGRRLCLRGDIVDDPVPDPADRGAQQNAQRERRGEDDVLLPEARSAHTARAISW